MLTIGNKSTFAFEICSDDITQPLIDIYIAIGGRRASGGNPVFISTFISYLKAFAVQQMEWTAPRDFSGLTYGQAYNIFACVVKTQRDFQNVKDSDIWNYHMLYNLDTAVDGWEIYIYDTEGGTLKNIICKERVPDSKTTGGNEVFGVTLPREEFFETINAVVDIFAPR